jgi:hypothetical protein
MRFSVSVAAWSSDPDATLPPEHLQLPAAIQALGFSVANVPVTDLAAGLATALTGVEPTDTLLIHISGTLAADGSLEAGASGVAPLRLVADALAARPCAHILVFVEAVYRGVADALHAVEQVEGVAGALSSSGGSRTTVIAVHPISSDVARLAFTNAVLDTAREVARPDGTALVEDAYGRARERGMGDIAASGFAFLRGDTPFVIGHCLAVAPPPPMTEPTLLAAEAPPAPAAPAAPQARVSLAAMFAAAALRVGRASSPEIVLTDLASPKAPVAPTASPETAPTATAPPDAAAPQPARISSNEWIEAVDVIDTSAHRVLDVRIAAALETADYRLAVQLCRERLATLTTVDARVDELFEIGRMLVAKLRDLPEAVVTLEEARAIDPSRMDVLEALRRAYTRLSRWSEALEVTLALIKLTGDAHERAGLRTAAAMIACQHLSDDDYGLEFLAAALDDNPGEEAALGELVRIRRSRGDLIDLEHALSALAHRLVELGAAARAWDVCQRLAALRRDDLGDAAGAVEALAIANRLPLTELDSRAVLAEQLLALGDNEGGVAELEAIVQAEPAHVRAHARLFSVHVREGDRDRAYLSALVLEELGDADATAREILESYRSDWGLRARASLDDAAWDALRARGADEVIESVFRASLRAGIAAQLEDRGRHPVLDPARRQPESTTATIVRCFKWAARALGVPCPALYVLDEVAGGIAAVSAPEPTTALGPNVLRGISSKTLAFLAGRHLTYFRPEYQILVHFPTVEAAAGIFFAAVELVSPGIVVPPNLALRVTSTKHRLARHLRPEDLDALSEAVGRLESREAKTDFIGWIRSVELTAARTGLLLAGDLQTALAQVHLEPRGLNGLGVDERRADLIAFCASRTLARLRSTYADTKPSSMHPPTSDSSVMRRDDLRPHPPGDAPGGLRMLA